MRGFFYELFNSEPCHYPYIFINRFNDIRYSSYVKVIPYPARGIFDMVFLDGVTGEFPNMITSIWEHMLTTPVSRRECGTWRTMCYLLLIIACLSSFVLVLVYGNMVKTYKEIYINILLNIIFIIE